MKKLDSNQDKDSLLEELKRLRKENKKLAPQKDKMLVLNLGHSPLYRHFYKCLYIELLKISLVY